MFYKLEKPKKFNEKDFWEIFKKVGLEKATQLFQKTSRPEYLHWENVKYKDYAKTNIKPEESWALIKFLRSQYQEPTVIKSESGKYFNWIKLQSMDQFFHEMDLNTGGLLFLSDNDIDENSKNRFISRGIMEEAIATSQLEGANTTREIAKKFLREGRKPKSVSEHMILNSYLTMKIIEDDYKNRELDMEMLLDLHIMISKNTEIREERLGKIREDSDDVVVGDQDGTIYHLPPKVSFVKEELDRFIKFANDELDTGTFIHPVIKAIMLHFWIGYLHPFVDGNGRLARSLFYWYLLKNRYWAFAYLPISKIIKRSPIQYGHAYIYSEQDDNDLTYFIDYNVRKIQLAIREFKVYAERKSLENVKMNKLAKVKYHLNDRQIRLLQYYYTNKDEATSPKTHMNINQISKATALKDLHVLRDLKFISSKKRGRNIYYYATDRIKELFK